MSEVIIGVDLGGTRIRSAQLDQQLQIIKREETYTLAEEGLEPTLGRIKDMIRKVFPEDGNVAGIGISAPGPLNPETGVIVHPPNLPGWQDVPLGDILQEEFGVPIYVGNDANVAVLAEACLGVAKGYKHAIYLTISTGIGSGMIVDGRLLLGASGLGAEVGHIIMIVEDRVSSLEEEAAGPDMAIQAVKQIKAGRHSQISDLVDGNLDNVTGKTVGDAAKAGDELAVEIVRRAGKIFGLGIVNLLLLFNPEIVIIGGGVANLGDLILDPMNEAIRKYCIDPAYWRDLKIVPPDLGEDVSIYGAAVLVPTKGGVMDILEVTKRLNR